MYVCMYSYLPSCASVCFLACVGASIDSHFWCMCVGFPLYECCCVDVSVTVPRQARVQPIALHSLTALPQEGHATDLSGMCKKKKVRRWRAASQATLCRADREVICHDILHFERQGETSTGSDSTAHRGSVQRCDGVAWWACFPPTPSGELLFWDSRRLVLPCPPLPLPRTVGEITTHNGGTSGKVFSTAQIIQVVTGGKMEGATLWIWKRKLCVMLSFAYSQIRWDHCWIFLTRICHWSDGFFCLHY